MLCKDSMHSLDCWQEDYRNNEKQPDFHWMESIIMAR